MTINLNQRSLNSYADDLSNKCYYEGLIGFWCTVTNVYSESHTVDVISSYGNYRHVPVMSHTWVNSKASEINGVDGCVSGEIFLPPKGSYVFMLMPDKTPDTGFILCSGYPPGSQGTHENFAKDSSEKKELDNAKKVITCGGWELTEDFKTGNFSLKNSDETIVLEINNEEGSVNIDSNGNTLELSNDGTISINGDDNGGLCITPTLVENLNKLTQRVDGIINAIKNGVPGTYDGGAALQQTIVAKLELLTDKEDFSEVESDTVFHGTGNGE